MSSPSLKEVTGKDSENGSNSSSLNGEGGGNNSDNSALVSFGNTSFGFNFESDSGFNNSSGTNSPDEGDSDQGDRKPKSQEDNKMAPSSADSPGAAAPDVSLEATENTRPQQQHQHRHRHQQQQQQSQRITQPQAPNLDGSENSPSLLNNTESAPAPLSAGAAAAKIQSNSLKPPHGASPSIDTTSALAAAGTHQDAAATAVANLNQIATDAVEKTDAENEGETRGSKRKSEDDGAGYNSDDEEEKSNVAIKNEQVANPPEIVSSAGVTPSKLTSGGSKKKKLDDSKREERNAREKERSFRISKQINELRTLLSSGGVIVPKGTKSSVLTEAANYIRMLQQHQYRSEIDRHQLVQQVQRIGSGALGQQAAQAVRHVAAQNGVWSLGNFGGVPPRSAMMYHQPAGGNMEEENQVASNNDALSNKIEESDYRHVFNSCTIGMAIASMGGAFIDCNKLFCQISNYTKQEICSLTVFNLTARQDLQSAFDLISQMLSAPLDPTVTNTSCVLRGALKHRTDVGLSVKLIKGNDGVAKCFCVTLIQNPSSPFDTSSPIPAVIAVAGQGTLVPGAKDPSQLNPSPAYTTG